MSEKNKEEVTIENIRKPRRIGVPTNGTIEKLTLGTTFEIVYPKEKEPIRLTISLTSDPKGGEILQITPLAQAIAEYRAHHKDEEIDPKKGVKIKYGSIDSQQTVTLMRIIDAPSSSK